ncbi:MAG TPA: alpha/beta fold hydrolase [Acidimicrobiales bacterium]|nr:alpha/beta fold hydrolase [Acidimicrobiales bacterium]
MPVVFVHGVPDTHHVWSPVIARIDRADVVAPDLPGFGGAPRPDGFAATKDDYVAWLVEQLRRLDGPVDLVGHDWGSLLVQRVASVAPDLVRTWTAGGAAIDPDYEWHDMAKLWQTPEVGEQVMAVMAGDAVVDSLAGAGVPRDHAVAAATRLDDEMRACILALYRSAVEVQHEWAPDLDRITAPGLVLHGARDPYVHPDHARYLGGRTGARVEILDCGHWWELERPDEVAALLTAHWAAA